MSVIFIPEKEMSSYLVNTEYIPITLVLNEKEYIKHIGFYYEDTDLCEFGLEPDTNELIKFVLTFSNHYEFYDDHICIPESESGKILLDYPSRIECTQFKVSAYCDGVHITLSDTKTVSFYKMGQMVLGIDINKNISEIYIIELTSDDTSFIKNELSLG